MKRTFILSLMFILAITINAQQAVGTALDNKPLSFNNLILSIFILTMITHKLLTCLSIFLIQVDISKKQKM